MNSSGIRPAGHRILVSPDKGDLADVAERSGLVLPDNIEDRENLGTNMGVIVAIGHTAWSEFEAPWAEVGDRVQFGRYAGQQMMGIDGKKYRVINDTDIAAIVDPEVKLGES